MVSKFFNVTSSGQKSSLSSQDVTISPVLQSQSSVKASKGMITSVNNDSDRVTAVAVAPAPSSFCCGMVKSARYPNPKTRSGNFLYPNSIRYLNSSQFTAVLLLLLSSSDDDDIIT